MIDYGLDNLPGGPLMVEGFTYIPHRFALGFAEAPRGDDIHWEHDRRQPEAVPLALPCRDLRELADPALHAAWQHCFRCAADYR